MKHLKKIEELFKSTYLSAADKLKNQHPTRSNNMMSWADEKGTTEFSKENVERLYPHGFVFKNNKFVKTASRFLGKFYITDYSQEGGLRPTFYGIEVRMMNEWGQKIQIDISYNRNQRWQKMDLYTINEHTEQKGKSEESKNFLFSDRKDARHFIRFINECIEDLDLPEPFEPLSINKAYYTA